MALNFVSEVDRNFFSNNLLTSEDLETTNVDISELLGVDTALDTDAIIRDFNHDFPNGLSLDPNNLALDDPCFQDDLFQEYSDSSDSGISGVTGQYDSTPSPQDPLIKQEPLSPASSLSSELSETSSSQNYGCIEIKEESPPLSPYNQQLTSTSLSSSSSLNILENGVTECVNPIIIGAQLGNVQSLNTSANINSILNTKVKIQPKPMMATSNTTTTTHQQKTVIPKAEPGKPLVLTPEEFQKLTAQGLLKFESPQPQTTKVEIPKVTTVVSPKPIITSNPILQADNEYKNVKRQQRMIKNRESASLSRKRKKEYLGALEEHLKEFTQQNQRLKEENELLKKRLSMIQSENEELKKNMSASPAKKICLMAIILMLSLNIGSISDLLLTSKTYFSNPPPGLVHHGRQLMSMEVEDTYSVSSFIPEKDFSKLRRMISQFPDQMKDISNKTLLELYTCPTFFNKTESLRLADQLSGWMVRHEEQKTKKFRKSARKQKPLARTHAAISGNLRQFKDRRRRGQHDSQNQLQLYPTDTVRDFWSSLPRRNDTFYVLSFSSDYFLVPAVAHNKTMRPRMSLVMPATTLNETMQPRPGSIGMMQIDCEVLNTQLIHVDKSSLPRQHRTRNSTDAYSEEEFFP